MPDPNEQPTSSPFGPFTRYVTSHGPRPSSSTSTTPTPTTTSEPPVIVHKALIQPTAIRTPQTPTAPNAWVGGIWSNTHPAQNTYSLGPDQARKPGESLVMKGGSNFQVTDLAPDEEVGMHRTNSVDYNIITHGSAWLITPGGEGEGGEPVQTLVRVGEVVVQRGTLHGWKAGPEGVRWVCVLVDASEGVKDEQGTELEEVSF